MKLIKTLVVVLVSLVLIPSKSFSNVSGDSTVSVVAQFDELSYRWDEIGAILEEYEGLSQYCVSRSFKTEVIVLLKGIHHYDSMVYLRLAEIAGRGNNHEIKKTISQIEEFETKYSIKNFIRFLAKECRERFEVEKHKKETANDVGGNSYSGQKLLVESSMYRYINHVTSLVDHIRKHVHHLDLDRNTDLSYE